MPGRAEEITLDEFFAGFDPLSRELFDAVRAHVESLGPVEVRASKSQVAFRARTAFAWAWIPLRYLKGEGFAPLVLTIGLRRRDPSPRWKHIAEPQPGLLVHHLELRSAEQLDDEVLDWLREAREGAR